jgi:eukaryotic-like serine/threonine-protein kinase
VLRNRARAHSRKMLLFVDQFEELYTLIQETEERLAFTACLAGMADDPVSPLRLLLSLRSDFLDRVAEDQHFMGELSQNLMFVTPPDRTGLRDAIVKPAEMMRYRFETPTMVEHMLDTLQTTPGCLPLLQFAATKLWEARDRDRRLLTEQSYRRIGGVVGALATHADAVLAAMPPPVQTLARTVLLQLVTPERTRAIASMAELRELTSAPQEVERLIHHLVDARLLVIQRSSRNGGATVEIVHEALIQSWPTLTHWLDENEGDAAFLEQLRTAAKQWEARGRSPDLLWRGETMQEARGWHRRYRGTLPALHEEFLRAAFALASRTARARRAAMLGTIAFLSLLVVAAGVALVSIRKAEREARKQAEVARTAEANANAQADKAREAEAVAKANAAEVQRQLDVVRQKDGVIQQKEGLIQEKEGLIQQKEDVIQEKEGALVDARKKIGTNEEDLAVTNLMLTDALAKNKQALADAKATQERAEAAQERAEALAEEAQRARQETQAALTEARAAQKKAEELLDQERARRDRRRKVLDETGQDLEIKKTAELE